MGLYINPTAMSKEAWINDHAVALPGPPDQATYEALRREGKVPVSLVDNGNFTAIGVAFDYREMQCMSSPNDTRPQAYFSVEISKLDMQAGIQPRDLIDFKLA
jgi:hypothetical protein